MKRVLFAISIALSFLGWGIYIWLSIIMERGSDLLDEQKYFANFPNWLAGVYKMGAVVWIVLPVAVTALLFSGYLMIRKFRTFSLVVLILDLLLFMMSFMLFM